MKTSELKDWDEIMFSLLEDEITGEERVELLSEINNDELLLDRWVSWQKTIYSFEEELDLPFIESLKKEDDRKPILLFRPWAIAASIALLVGLAYVLTIDYEHQNEELAGISTEKDEIPQPPAQKAESTTIVDSAYESVPNPIVKAIVNPKVKPAPIIMEFQETPSPTIESPAIADNTPQKIEEVKTTTEFDSIFIDDLKNLIVSIEQENARARGNEIQVFITDLDESPEIVADNRIQKLLGSYELNGFKRNYSIIKEECESETFCYTLVLQNGSKTTYLKL